MKAHTTKILLFIAAVVFPFAAFAADSNVRINSIGFLPNNVKGFTCNVSATNFTVVRVSDSATVYSGTLGGAVTVSDSGETVYKGDFSAFTTPGTYRVNVAGVGNSVNFVIADDVYNQTFITVERAMYLWRCNTAVSGSFTYNGQTNTFSHAACHMNDAYLDYVNGSHTIRNGKGGWHDAGDYNKYIVNAGATVGPMFMAWEHFGAQINTLDTGIPNDPEAGQDDSAYPDYLKELRYEIKYVLRSAYPDGTGRVSAKLSALDFDAFEPPENETADRFFTSWGSAATADYVAMLAMAARVFYPYDPAYSQTCITAARTAYNYLLANTANVNPDYTDFSTGGYGTTDGDDRLWAAAEMWATTGDTDAHTDFQARANGYADKTDEDWDWSNMKNLGMYTYLRCTRTGKNATILNDIQADLIADANAAVTKSTGHGYGRNLGTNYYWGCNGAVARQVMLFQIANMVSPNANYVTASLNALGYLFGRNYHRRSYVTDVGVSAPMFPHDRRSGSDGITNPWPGYLVGGSSGVRNDPWQTANLAAGLPAAQYWSDVQDSYSSNEIAINWQAGLIYALAAFIGTSGTPTFTATQTPYLGTATNTPTNTPVFTATNTPIVVAGVVSGECAEGQAITIDGSLNEPMWSSGTWTNVTRVVEGTQGAVSARFKVKWDSLGIIVGVEVTDPVLCNTNTTWYNDDSIEVYLDMSNNHSTTYVLGDDYQFSVRYGEDVIMEQNGYAVVSSAYTALISGGYSAEFDIEWDDLGMTAPSSERTIGFDVGINHDETCGGTRTGVLMWNGTGNNYTNTSAFGDAVLQVCGAAPTSTFTATRTVTRTATRTRTPTFTPTNTTAITNTFTATRTNTQADTFTNTPVNTATYSRTATPTGTRTITRSATASVSPTFTYTRTRTNTPVNTVTDTPVDTSTFTRTLTPTGTRTYTLTATQTFTGTSTGTRTVTRTPSPSRTNTPVYSPTETQTGTPPTDTVTPTITETYTLTPTGSATGTFTRTVTETASPTVTVTDTTVQSPTFTTTSTPGDTATNTPVNTASATASVSPTNTPVDTVTNTPVNTMTNTPVNTVTRTFTRTATPTLTLTSNLSPVFTPTATHTPVIAPTSVVYIISNTYMSPNPFNLTAGGNRYFTCDLTQNTRIIKIRIYTMSFRAIKEITINGPVQAGIGRTIADNTVIGEIAAGIYYYTTEAESVNGVKSKATIGSFQVIK